MMGSYGYRCKDRRKGCEKWIRKQLLTDDYSQTNQSCLHCCKLFQLSERYHWL